MARCTATHRSLLLPTSSKIIVNTGFFLLRRRSLVKKIKKLCSQKQFRGLQSTQNGNKNSGGNRNMGVENGHGICAWRGMWETPFFSDSLQLIELIQAFKTHNMISYTQYSVILGTSVLHFLQFPLILSHNRRIRSEYFGRTCFADFECCNSLI